VSSLDCHDLAVDDLSKIKRLASFSYFGISNFRISILKSKFGNGFLNVKTVCFGQASFDRKAFE